MQAQRLATYNINQVSFTVNGLILGDLPAPDWITVEANRASFEFEEAANGGVCRFATNTRVLKIKYKVKGNSSDNTKLSTLHALDENSDTGAGVGAGLLKDNNGATLFTGQCWIEGLPSTPLGQSKGDVEWTIIMVRQRGTGVVGGN